MAFVIWLGEHRGHLVDWVTQRWVQLTGTRLARASTVAVGPGGLDHGHRPFLTLDYSIRRKPRAARQTHARAG